MESPQRFCAGYRLLSRGGLLDHFVAGLHLMDTGAQLEDAIEEIGGEPLEGSGFENEQADEAANGRDPSLSAGSET
jgi:hypothetical protein